MGRTCKSGIRSLHWHSDEYVVPVSRSCMQQCADLSDTGQYTITGFDASAHLSEETRKASWSAPIGVLTSIICSSLFGFFLILCLLFSIQDFDATVDSEVGQPVLQILLDIFGENGAIVLFTLVRTW